MEDNMENSNSSSDAVVLGGQKWIDDEGFLRDEGILFGYTNASPDQKLEAIDHYYQSKINPLKLQAGYNNREEIGINNQIANLLKPIEISPAAPLDIISNYFFRNIFGLLLTAGACFFNYFLIAHDLRSPDSNSQFISIGVYLFGIFMTFTPKNLLFYSNDDETNVSKSIVYLYLLEFGAPLVSSLFVAYRVLVNHGVATALIHFIFILLLFIIPGKLFLSLLKQVTDDLKRIRSNVALKRAVGVQEKVFSGKKEVQDQQLKSLNEKLKIEIEKRLIGEKEIARLEEEKENKKKLFMSEYNLARTFSSKFINHQQINFLT